MTHRLVVITMSVALAGVACKKKSEGAGGGAGTASGSDMAGTGGSAAPAGPEVSCKDAAKKYTEAMAAAPGNPLSDMKPNGGAVAFARVTLEEDCDNGWNAETRACIGATAAAADFAKCWKDPNDPFHGDKMLANVVEEMKQRKAANEGGGSAEAGSGSGS